MIIFFSEGTSRRLPIASLACLIAADCLHELAESQLRRRIVDARIGVVRAAQAIVQAAPHASSFDFLMERGHSLFGCLIKNLPGRKSCAARST